MLEFFVFTAAVALLLLLLWLGYCAWIAHVAPEHAASIIEATGRWFPFRGSRWPWTKGGN